MYSRFKNYGRSEGYGRYAWSGMSKRSVRLLFVSIMIMALFLSLFGLKPLKIYGEDGGTGSVQDFVSRFYETCLSRQPDEAGLAKFTSDLSSGLKTGADIAKEITGSKEFKSRNLSNQDYLTVLYRAFFNREPDAQGLAIWLDRLNKGSSRSYVLSGFVNSTEFVNLCRNYNVRAGYLPGTPAEPSAKTKIIGSPVFIQSINQALIILATSDNPVYCQIAQVKKIEERALDNEWIGMADGTNVYLDLVKVTNTTPSESVILNVASILSHEFNHVINRNNYYNMEIVEFEKLATAQELSTAIKIGAPGYIIDFLQNLIINIYDPETWWWAPLIPVNW